MNDSRILIVGDDDLITASLSILLKEAGFESQIAPSITAGCAAARSGAFQVVFTTATSEDGSWRRLTDIARQYGLGFLVILVAANVDFEHCVAAQEEGAFDVLDPLHELSRTAESAKCALWAAYLMGLGSCPEFARHPNAA